MNPQPQPTKSWRDVLPVHPAADVFPMMTKAELEELAKDIRTNGLQNPVLLWEQVTAEGTTKYLLDGRNRLDAMELAGVPVITGQHVSGHLTRTADVTASTAGALVVALNIKRRHLTPKQRADLAAEAIVADREFVKAAKKALAKPDGKELPAGRDQHGRFAKDVPAYNRSAVAEVAESAKVSRPTARKAVRQAEAKAGIKPALKLVSGKPAKAAPAPKVDKATAARSKAINEAATLVAELAAVSRTLKRYSFTPAEAQTIHDKVVTRLRELTVEIMAAAKHNKEESK